MSDLNTNQGKIGPVHTRQPDESGTPVSGIPQEAPKGEVHFGYKGEGIGCSRKGLC